MNKTRGMVFSGFLRGFGRLDDATRWRFLTYTAGEASPPPHESVLRCERHPGFRLVFNARWRDVAADAEGVTVTTAEGPQRFDAVIFGTGFTVDPARMPELAAFRDAMQLWGDRVAPEEAARYPELARAPYLGEGFELTPRDPASLLAGALARLRLLGPAAASSHGILSGDIPAVGTGCTTLAREIGQALFAEEVGGTTMPWSRSRSRNWPRRPISCRRSNVSAAAERTAAGRASAAQTTSGAHRPAERAPRSFRCQRTRPSPRSSSAAASRRSC